MVCTDEAARESGSMVKHFFIVGAPRAGTTWLATALGGHSQVHLSPVKEPHFFAPPVAGELSDVAVTDKNLWDEIAKHGHVHNGWIQNPSNYARLLTGSPDKLLAGEATVAYLHAPGAPKAIADKFPGAYIIAILREPVARALSHIRMDAVLGLARLHHTDILCAELDAASRHGIVDVRYLGRSLYSAALKRYMNHFPKGRLLVLRFDDIQSAPAMVLSRVTTFLGISAQEFHEQEMRPSNQVHDARWQLFNRWLVDSGIKRVVRAMAPPPVLSIGKRIFYVSPRSERLPAALRERLNTYFEPDILETARLTGLDLSSWVNREQES